MSEHKDSVMV